jgi:transposase InsO family protein
MSWIAMTGGISGEMIRDLMLESLERLFNDRVVPHLIEWLSDNGSCYRAHETISFAQSIGLVPCFAPGQL